MSRAIQDNIANQRAFDGRTIDLASLGMETDETAGSPGIVRLTLVVGRAAEGDDAELDQLTRQLRAELLDTDVHDVRLLREGKAPPGAKVVDPATIGALVVTLAPSAIPGLMGLVQGWLRGRPAAGVKVTLGRDSIELTNATDAQVEQLTRAFLTRHHS
jgi:Effector Associated Constant Component 1